MRRTAIATAAAWVALLATAASAGAETTITVEPRPGDDAFAPANVTTSLSDAQFRWVWGAGGVGTLRSHDVVQEAELFSSGTPKSSGQYRLSASAGRFPYFCSLHAGMRGALAVRPEAAAGYPNPFRVSWASSETQSGKRFDVRYKAEGGSQAAGAKGRRRSTWHTWLEDAKSFSGVFGRRGKPVAVRNGGTYRIQVRSENSNSASSGWSPPLVVGP